MQAILDRAGADSRPVAPGGAHRVVDAPRSPRVRYRAAHRDRPGGPSSASPTTRSRGSFPAVTTPDGRRCPSGHTDRAPPILERLHRHRAGREPSVVPASPEGRASHPPGSGRLRGGSRRRVVRFHRASTTARSHRVLTVRGRADTNKEDRSAMTATRNVDHRDLPHRGT
jgi:hypothetical protein